MGAIRKTMSVGTLGVVNFRGKKELLERALIEAELRRLNDAETKAAKQLARLRRRSRRVRKAERLSALLPSAPPAVAETLESARESIKDTAHQGRRRGRRARKAAKQAAHDLRVGAERALDDARAALSS